MRPAAIIERLDLRRPIFKRTAAYGHFGRTDGDGFTWENTEPYADELRRAAASRRQLTTTLAPSLPLSSSPTSPRSSARSTTRFPTRTSICGSARSCASRCTAGGCAAGSSPTTSNRSRRRRRCWPCIAVVSAGPPPEVVDADRVGRAALVRPARRSPAQRVAARTASRRVRAPARGRVGRVPRRLRTATMPTRRRPVAAAARPAARWSRSCRARGSTIVVCRRRRRARALAAYCVGAGRAVALLHSDSIRRGAHRRRGHAPREGECVVVGGRIAAFAPVPDLACGGRRRRRRRGAAGGADADVARARGARRTGDRRARVPFTVCSPAPTRRGGGPLAEWSTARHPTSNGPVGPGSRWSTGARSRPALVCSRRRWPMRCTTPRGLGRVRAEPPGPGPPPGVRLPCQRRCCRWDRGRPSVPARVSRVRRRREAARSLRAGVTRVREELAALLPGARGRRGRRRDRRTVPDADRRRHRGGAAPRRGPPARDRRSSRSSTSTRSCSRPATAPRAGAVAARARRATARVHGRAPSRCCCSRPACPTTRSSRRSSAATRGWSSTRNEPGAALGFPPFGALAELSGDGTIARVDAAVDTSRRLDVQSARRCPVFGARRRSRGARARARRRRGLRVVATALRVTGRSPGRRRRDARPGPRGVVGPATMS